MTRHSVYTFWDAQGRPLCVGCTSDFVRRIRWHRTYREWFGEIDRIDVQMYPDCETGTAAESARIRELNPLHNRALTDHDTPRTQPCPRCRRSKHAECTGMRGDEPCPCSICRSAAQRSAA